MASEINEDVVVSFQEATTGLPVTGQILDYGWQFTLDDCAEEWARAASPTEADANLAEARRECERLTRLCRGVTDDREVVAIVRKEGHSAEAI